MTRMGPKGVSPGASAAPAALSRRAARWAAAGGAAAAMAAAGLAAAPAASAAPPLTIAVACRVSALNAAIAFAPSNTILSLAKGCTYNLISALPNVIRNLTIQGNGDTIQGNGDTIRRVAGTFTILNVISANLSINQLTVSNGRGAGSFPGALRNVGGTVAITNSSFLNNQGGVGGAIRNDGGSLAVSNTRFAFNSATTGGGAIANFALGATTSVTVSAFLGNTAPSGGAIYSLIGSVTVTGSSPNNSTSFTGNDASGRAGDGGEFNGPLKGGGSGGAIYNAAGPLRVTNATFTGNRADSDGGAVQNIGSASTLASSGFTRNSAGDDGGAISTTASLNLTDDTISLNRAGDDGGGVFVDGGTTTLSKTVVFLNRAGDTGGGIRRNSGFVSLTNNTLVVANSPNDCSPFIFGC